jgi:hypothetical protein
MKVAFKMTDPGFREKKYVYTVIYVKIVVAHPHHWKRMINPI